MLAGGRNYYVIYIRFHVLADMFDVSVREIIHPKYRDSMAARLTEIAGCVISEDAEENSRLVSSMGMSRDTPAFKFIVNHAMSHRDTHHIDACTLERVLEANFPGMCMIVKQQQ